MKPAIIGGGNMGGALAKAIISNQIAPLKDLLIIEADSAKRQTLEQNFQCSTSEGLTEALHSNDVVVIAIKPQKCETLLKQLADYLQPNQVVVSVMAGINLAFLKEHLRHEAIARVMPNTPAQIGMAMSVFYCAPQVSQDQVNAIQTLLNAMGESLQVDNEEKIDAATAISGSGPAYLFFMAEQAMFRAQSMGFPKHEAELLVRQTFKGAVHLWEETGLDPSELRKKVTSPGGTTEAALKSFEAREIGVRFQEGIHKAFEKARELARLS